MQGLGLGLDSHTDHGSALGDSRRESHAFAITESRSTIAVETSSAQAEIREAPVDFDRP